jgi:hypothetical protein
MFCSRYCRVREIEPFGDDFNLVLGPGNTVVLLQPPQNPSENWRRSSALSGAGRSEDVECVGIERVTLFSLFASGLDQIDQRPTTLKTVSMPGPHQLCPYQRCNGALVAPHTLRSYAAALGQDARSNKTAFQNLPCFRCQSWWFP